MCSIKTPLLQKWSAVEQLLADSVLEGKLPGYEARSRKAFLASFRIDFFSRTVLYKRDHKNELRQVSDTCNSFSNYFEIYAIVSV